MRKQTENKQNARSAGKLDWPIHDCFQFYIWLAQREWCEFSGPITEQSKEKPALKIALRVIILSQTFPPVIDPLIVSFLEWLCAVFSQSLVSWKKFNARNLD